jgi:hypothetical protein
MNPHTIDMTELNPQNEEKQIIDNIKNKLRQGNDLINCDIDELQYIKKPIGKSIYQAAREQKKQKKNKYISNETITCELCAKKYRRSNKSFHEKTSYHLTYKHVNDKFTQFMLN